MSAPVKVSRKAGRVEVVATGPANTSMTLRLTDRQAVELAAALVKAAK